MAVNTFDGSTDSNWGTAANWSLGTVPTASDGHDTTFDATSPNCTVNASNRVCNRITFVGYTNTITMTFAITVSGNITLDSGMGISGSALLAVAAASTITSNGKTWPNNFSSSGTNTITLVGDFTISGSLINSGATTINKTTSEKLYVGNGVSGTQRYIGTSTLNVSGGTIAATGTQAYTITIELNGTLTLASIRLGGLITYVSGTITTSGLIIDGAASLDLQGLVFTGTCSIITSATINILSDVTFNLLSNSSTAFPTINRSGSQVITITNGMTIGAAMLGTALVNLTGGTWSGSFGFGLHLNLNGNITVSGTVAYYNSATMTYVSGAVTTTSSTLSITASVTLDTNGVTWNNVTITTGTQTINSLLSVSSTLLFTGSATFAGTAGWTCATLSHTGTTAATITLKEAITYTVTTLLSCFTTRTGSSLLFTSAHGTTKANLTLSWGATCRCLSNFTRIDASGGRPIRAFNSTIVDSSYIISISDLKTATG